MKRRLSLLALLLFAGFQCGSLHGKGIDSENSRIALSLAVEPPNLDSSLSTDTTSSLILGLITEGLVVTNRRGGVDPGIADHWETNGLETTFWLRDAVWSDGKPVTAHDFVYAFRRLVNPATGASGSTFFAYILKNAVAIMAGKKPVDSLGVEAVDNKTLKVTLSRPAPYFLTVLSSTAYRPLREDFVTAQSGQHGSDPEHLLFNGPFVLETWIHSASLRLRKNQKYWDTENVHLNELDFGYITSDTRALLNLYKSEELAALRLNEDILADTLEYGLRVQKAPTNCLNWIMLNLSPDKPTSNLKLRRAIRLALDRDTYANTIVGLPGTRIINSVFTHRMRGVKESFQKEYPAQPIEYNLQKARQLLAEAKKDLGIDQFPPLVMLINETRQIEAEFVQSQLINTLGLNVRVDKQTFKQSLVKFRNGDFDLARSGFCGGTLQDPVFFAGIFTSDSPFNDMKFQNQRYDELMEITHSSADQKIRMQAFSEMQNILYDQVPIIPTIESAWVYVQDRQLRGLVRYPTVDFSHSRIHGYSN